MVLPWSECIRNGRDIRHGWGSASIWVAHFDVIVFDVYVDATVLVHVAALTVACIQAIVTINTAAFTHYPHYCIY